MRVFVKVFIVSSIIFTLLMARSFDWLFGGGWLSALLAGIIIGSVFGLVLATIAYLASRFLNLRGCILVIILSSQST
jgi:Zn-dependent protease with chaperone function